MSDIMSFIRHAEAVSVDPDGRLLDLDLWSEEIAEQLAAAEGIVLTGAHWELIYFLRDYYRDYGPTEHAHELLAMLQSRMGEDGRKALYRLFPGGPVQQACKIAGIPTPQGASNPGFGSVM